MLTLEQFLKHGGAAQNFPSYGYDIDLDIYLLKGTRWKPSKLSSSFEVIEFTANGLGLVLDNFLEIANEAGFCITDRSEAVELIGSAKDLKALHQKLIELQFRSAFSAAGYQDSFVDVNGDIWHLRPGKFLYLDNFAEEEGELDYEGVRLINTTRFSQHSIKFLADMPEAFRELLCDNIAIAGIEDVVSRDQSEVWTVLDRIEPDDYDYESDSHTEVIEEATTVLAKELKEALASSQGEFESLIYLNRGYIEFWNLAMERERCESLDGFAELLQRILEEMQ